MKIARRGSCVWMFSLLAAMFYANAYAMEKFEGFQLSGKVYETTWPAGTWTGKHAFPEPFCVVFPSPHKATNLSQAYFNKQSAYLVRANYPSESLLVFLATSIVPPGIRPEDEVMRTLSHERSNEAQSGGLFHDVKQIHTFFGPGVSVGLVNVLDDSKHGPFPFAKVTMSSDVSDVGNIKTVGTTRFLVYAGNRLEVAVLKEFPSKLDDASFKQAKEQVNAYANQFVDSLTHCTLKLK